MQNHAVEWRPIRGNPMLPPWSTQERTLVSSITNLARNVFWAVGSAAAGVAIETVAFSALLVFGGGAKIACDILSVI
jgi:hypothetical protein